LDDEEPGAVNGSYQVVVEDARKVVVALNAWVLGRDV
jgi:hypothetical protein